MSFNLTVMNENVIFMGLNVCFYINCICICNSMSYVIYFVTGTTIKSAVWWQQLYIAKGSSTECYRRSGSQHYPSSLTVYQPNEPSCWCILYILSHSSVFPSGSRHSQWHHNWHPVIGASVANVTVRELEENVTVVFQLQNTVSALYVCVMAYVFCSQTCSQKLGQINSWQPAKELGFVA